MDNNPKAKIGQKTEKIIMRIVTSIFRIALCMALGLSLLATISCNGKQPQEECATFQEMQDPTNDTLSDWSHVTRGLHASFISIDEKLPKSVAPEITPVNRVTVSGWKGERVSAQLLLWSAEEIQQVEYEIGEFKGDDNVLPRLIAKAVLFDT